MSHLLDIIIEVLSYFLSWRSLVVPRPGSHHGLFALRVWSRIHCGGRSRSFGGIFLGGASRMNAPGSEPSSANSGMRSESLILCVLRRSGPAVTNTFHGRTGTKSSSGRRVHYCEPSSHMPSPSIRRIPCAAGNCVGRPLLFLCVLTAALAARRNLRSNMSWFGCVLHSGHSLAARLRMARSRILPN